MTTSRTPAEPAASSRAKTWSLRLLPAAILMVALGLGILPRVRARTAVREQTLSLAIPTVSVVNPEVLPLARPIDLPADVQPYQSVAINARISGYIGKWFVDIGAHVSAGQLLAVIEAPEMDAQLERAKGDAAAALANYQIARTTAERWQDLLKSNSVSRQEAEQDTSTMKARGAALIAARADVDRLSKMQAFEKAYAPFAGVVTDRGIDVGTLIDSGATGAARQLFHLVETDKLRVFVNVPQDLVGDAGIGTTAKLTLPQWPGRSFTGVIARSTGAIDPISRTLRVEIDVDNPDGSILPGAYASVRLNAKDAEARLSVPVSALLFRPDGIQVATINAANRVAMQSVTLGRDFGTRIEISTGLDEHARVVANPSDAIAAGEFVTVVANTQPQSAP
ncbi:MAG TPA: efflux RND transporter periplasmic adaptor subunit [Steroidobacteraceae bacterium]